ncbi:MAG: glycosyltransferase, partial [Gammaproteobacteria bacterium]|nr:glycosyltransferase [Gammaproteobacteria bacterium]
DALFLPSREEGFGIPVLEAGLLGLPIYCSDIAALREIAGDMAIYFSPDDSPFEIAQRVSTHLCSDARYKLRAHVRENYTWETVYANYIEPLLEVGQ